MVAAAKSPVKYDVTVYKGASWNFNVGVVDANGVARDLSGYAVRMAIKTKDSDVAAVNSYAVGSGITANLPQGTIAVAVPDTDTAAWTFDSGVFDLIIDNGTTGGVEVLLRGGITARRKVTT